MDNEQQQPQQNIPVDDPLTVAISAANMTKRRAALTVGAIIIGFIVLIVLLVTGLGIGTTVYAEANNFSNIAWFISLVIPVTTGILAAYLTAHPVAARSQPATPKSLGIFALVLLGLCIGVLPGLVILAIYLATKSRKVTDPQEITQSLVLKPVNFIFVILSFILGIIPGFILAFVISYPLSKHACELSGSKYC
jgi:hypothetical protein